MPYTALLRAVFLAHCFAKEASQNERSSTRSWATAARPFFWQQTQKMLFEMVASSPPLAFALAVNWGTLFQVWRCFMSVMGVIFHHCNTFRAGRKARTRVQIVFPSRFLTGRAGFLRAV